jgi:thiamine pyrophosphate-dependent acetolactate synthase large subunit-like protein
VRVLAELRAVLPADGILLSDAGAHHNWIVQEWQPGGPGTLLQSYFGQELATSFRYAASGAPYRCDFAAMARAMGADGMRAETAADLSAALKTALDSRRPTVIDVPVAAEVPQPAVATWDLPPLSYPEPGFGWPDPASTDL